MERKVPSPADVEEAISLANLIDDEVQYGLNLRIVLADLVANEPEVFQLTYAAMYHTRAKRLASQAEEAEKRARTQGDIAGRVSQMLADAEVKLSNR